MSNYLVTDTELTQTANAIRTKAGTSGTIAFVSGTGFKSAIEALPSGGVVISPLSVAENGTYTAQSGHAYSPVTVNVPSFDVFVNNFSFGNWSGTLPKIVLDGAYVDFANATSDYRGIITKYINFSSLSSWELCCSFKDYSPSSIAFPVFGTHGNNYYYYNPSVEVKSSTNIWGGCTATSGEWTTGIDCTLTEAISSSYEYQIKFGWNGTKLYISVTNLSSDEEIGYEEIAISTNPHTYTSSSNGLVIGNNADQSTSRFQFLGKIMLLGSYIKENGVITWGADEL